MIYLYSFSNLSHFQSTILYDHFMHFCDKFWGSSTFWPFTMWSSSKLSQPNLYSLVHLATVEYELSRVPQCILKVGINFLYIHTFLYKIFSFFHFHKSVCGNNNRVVTTTVLQQEHWHATCSLSKDTWLLCGNLAVLTQTSRGDSKNFSNHTRKQ